MAIELASVAQGAGIVHLTLLACTLTYFGKHAENDKVKKSLRSSPAAPLAVFISFFVLDMLIAWVGTNSECVAAGLVKGASSYTDVAITSFSTLIIVTLCNLWLGSAPRQLSVAFSLATHMMIVMTYSQIAGEFGAGAVVWRTWYGSFFWPSRLNLWLHSSMSQVLSFAATPRAADFWGTQRVLHRVADVYWMFLFGFLAYLPPPDWLPAPWHMAIMMLSLITSASLMIRILIFMHAALPLCLYIPTEEGETDAPWGGSTSSNDAASASVAMRALRHLIVGTWIVFPAIWVAASLGIIDPAQEVRIH